MSKERKYKYMVGDFETSVYAGQDHTEVWASAVVEMYTEDVKILHSIDETFSYLKLLKTNVIIYFHNLKFDGSFWLSYLMKDLHYEQAIQNRVFLDTPKMLNNTFKYSISELGQWYSITIKVNNYIIEIRDSLKLLPFSVKEIGKSFKTKHQKLEMEYKGFRYAGCVITDEEKEYIANDVLVVKEALEIMFNEGHNSLTIGSCCLKEFKRTIAFSNYRELFPDLYQIKIQKKHKYKTAGEFIHRSYKGGWCFVKNGIENIIYILGLTADVNSLYPSMMHSMSGNKYPVGMPKFWTGNYIPDEAKKSDSYYFVRIVTRFKIKKGHLPFIQIKGNVFYKPSEMLETSDIYNKRSGKYLRYYKDATGEICPATVEMVMTMTDYILFREHYDVEDFEILDGCYFHTEIGLFDEYINHYMEIKINSIGALRTLAKLFLNNLYGKLASSTDSSFKLAYLEDDVVKFINVNAEDKEPGYIAIGSAITSYARNFTIRAAQANYDTFLYADTDSIHCATTPDKIKGIKVHPTDFCCWKLESTWDFGLFVRQKTYIERVIEKDLEPVKPYYNVKCAGMPERCKNLFLASVAGLTHKDTKKLEKEYGLKDLTEEQEDFLDEEHKITDFKVGLKIPGKLLPKRIKGGILLTDTLFTMKGA